MTMKEWENKMLAMPETNSISPEHDEHKPSDPEFVQCNYPDLSHRCMCRRCRIIRIKRRRTHLFPRFKCPNCGELFGPSIYRFCDKCIKAESY